MQTALIPVIIAAVVIAVLVLLLASARKSQTGPAPLSGSRAWVDCKYPAGYRMKIGIAAGVVLGLGLGLAVGTFVGGISIGIGVGLILGKLLTQRYDKDTRQWTEDQKLERLRHATWAWSR